MEQGSAAEAEQAARFALAQLARFCDYLNDEEGELGEVAVEVADVHSEACRAAGPDPAELADWLSVVQLSAHHAGSVGL